MESSSFFPCSAYDDLSACFHDWFWVCDRDGIISHSSPAVEEILGFAPARLAGCSLGSLLHAEEQAVFLCALQARPRTAQIRNQEFRFIDSRGAARLLLVSCTPFTCGTEACFFGVARDQSVPARQQITRLYCIEFLRRVIESSPNPIVVKDGCSRIVLTNQAVADLVGMRVEQLIGKTDFEVAGQPVPDVLTADNDEDLGVLAKGLPRRYEPQPLMVPDGREIWLQVSKFPLLLPNGTTYLLAVAVDMTAHHQQQQQLKDHQQELLRQNQLLEEANTTLRYLLRQRDEERQAIEANIVLRVKALLGPTLERFDHHGLSVDQQAALAGLQSLLATLSSAVDQRLERTNYQLSPNELQIAAYIRDGLQNKEIARILGLSVRTIESYRLRLRKKLGLEDTACSLRKTLQKL